MDEKLSVLLDMGGSKIRIAFANSEGKIDWQNLVLFPNSNNFEVDLKKIEESIRSYVGGQFVRGISIGFAGTVEDDNKVIISQNLSLWNEKEFVHELSEKFGGCPVYLRNDAAMAALGEAIYGGAKQKDFIYITWGTGIGGCKVEFDRGKPIVRNLDWWKYFEKWEIECGGRFVKEKYDKLVSVLSDEEWMEVMGDFFDNVAIIADKLDCDSIVLGGGVVAREVDKIQEFVKTKDVNLEIIISKLGKNSGLYGSLALLDLNIE